MASQSRKAGKSQRHKPEKAAATAAAFFLSGTFKYPEHIPFT